MLNDLTGPSAGPLAQITYSIPFRDQWKSASYVKLLQGHDVDFALEEYCYWHKTQDGAVKVQEVKELRSKHEEADTRMVFHANYIEMQCHGISPTVVIRSCDTDVFVLLLYHQNHVNANIWMDTSTSSKNTRRLIMVLS